MKILNLLSRIFLSPILFLALWRSLYTPQTVPTYWNLVTMYAVITAAGIVLGLLVIGVFALIAAAAGGKVTYTRKK